MPLAWQDSRLSQDLISSLSPYHFWGVDHCEYLAGGGTSADAINLKGFISCFLVLHLDGDEFLFSYEFTIFLY